MTMWEYDQINLNELPRKMNALDVLNDAGAEGWELVTLTALNIAILKRPPERKKTTRSKATQSARVRRILHRRKNIGYETRYHLRPPTRDVNSGSRDRLSCMNLLPTEACYSLAAQLDVLRELRLKSRLFGAELQGPICRMLRERTE